MLCVHRRVTGGVGQLLLLEELCTGGMGCLKAEGKQCLKELRERMVVRDRPVDDKIESGQVLCGRKLLYEIRCNNIDITCIRP